MWKHQKKAMDRRNRSHPFLAFRISASKIATWTAGQMKKEAVPRREKKVLYYCCYSISFVSENVWNTEIMVFKKRPQTCIQNWISILNALHTLTRSYQYFHQNFQHPMLKGAPFFAKNPPKAAKSHLRWAYLQNFRVFAFTFNLFASHPFQPPPFFKPITRLLSIADSAAIFTFMLWWLLRKQQVYRSTC